MFGIIYAIYMPHKLTFDSKVSNLYFRNTYQNVCLFLDEKKQDCTLYASGFVDDDVDYITWSAKNDNAVSKGTAFSVTIYNLKILHYILKKMMNLES